MKLVTFYISDDLQEKHLGIVDKERVIDLFESAIILKSLSELRLDNWV